MKYLNFKIHGDYITQTARDIYQKGDLKKALSILMDCLICEKSYNERLYWCLLILNNKACIKGTYPDDDYDLSFNSDEYANMTDKAFEHELFTCLSYCQKKAQNINDKYTELKQKYDFIIGYDDAILLSTKRIMNADYHDQYGSYLFDEMSDTSTTPATKMLDDYMKMAKYDDNYGWLAPDGTFYPVEWSNHTNWAVDWLNENRPFETNQSLYFIGDHRHIVGGDVLIYKLHWCLIHSPHQGIGKPLYDKAYDLTKAQKEFLYDYYIERGEHNMANAIYA